MFIPAVCSCTWQQMSPLKLEILKELINKTRSIPQGYLFDSCLGSGVPGGLKPRPILCVGQLDFKILNNKQTNKAKIYIHSTVTIAQL